MVPAISSLWQLIDHIYFEVYLQLHHAINHNKTDTSRYVGCQGQNVRSKSSFDTHLTYMHICIDEYTRYQSLVSVSMTMTN